MKKSIYLSLIALMFSVASFAQQNEQADNQPKERKAPTVEEIAKHKADRMRQQLLLGNDQYDKVYKLCLEQAKKEVARREEMKAENEAFAKDMKGILNEAQQERFEQMQKPRPNAPRNGQFRPQGRQPFPTGPKHFQAPNIRKGGEIRLPQQEQNRRHKMVDDMNQAEPTANFNSEQEAFNLTAMNYNGGIVAPYIVASVEADLLG